MSNAIVFVGSEGPSQLQLPPGIDFDLTVAADSGYDLALRLSIPVDVFIGDMDSTKHSTSIQAQKIVKLQRDKDISDTEAALQIVREHAIDSYVLVGGGGGRLDHLYGILTLFNTYGPPLAWFTQEESLLCISDTWTGRCRIGATLSLLPACIGASSLVTTHGLKWDVCSYQVNSRCISLSNEVSNEEVTIQVVGSPIFLSLLA